MSDYTTENIAELAPQVLTPAKKKNHYECPICNQPKFSVNPGTGAYSCFGGCDSTELHEVIKRLAGVWKEKREKQQPEPLINGQGLTEKNYKDFAGSGVPVEIVNEVACGTDNYATIAKFLGWNGYYGDTGVIVRSVDLEGKLTEYGQYKPSKPHKWNRPDKKDSKYLSAGGPAQAVLVPVPGVNWQEVRDDISVPIFVTEGYKKAIKIMIYEWDLPDEEYKKFPCISLNGVTLWHEKEKEDVLVPRLEEFAQYKRRFIIAFDADYRTNSQVRTQLKKLAKRLLERGCQVDIAFWPNTKQTKGIDDLLVAGKEDQLQIKPFDEWLKIQDKVESSEVKEQVKRERDAEPPSQSACASEIVETYRGKLTYLASLKKWYLYKNGIWEKQHADFVARDVIQPWLDKNEIEYSINYLNGIQNIISKKIATNELDQIGDKIPFKNGCLDLITMKLEEHSPSNYLTWCLPYEYDPKATCEPIIEWLKSAVKHDDQVQLLVAYLAGIIRGRLDLQRYLELQGPGGSGKSTYMNLAIALVGMKNTYSTKLQQLEGNRFETAAIKGKKLITIADSDKYGGDVSVLKAITGQDAIRYEEKNVQPEDPFFADGLVLLACNEPIQSSDYTSGLTRRRIVVRFDHVVPESDRVPLIEFKKSGSETTIAGKLAPFIPGLMNWVLKMSNDDITNYLRFTKKFVPSLDQVALQAITDTNPMAQWADQFLILDKGSKTQIGTAVREKDNDIPRAYMKSDEWLYASYCEWAVSMGYRTVAQNKFTSNLLDLLQNTLKIDFVACQRSSKGRFMSGVNLRADFNDKTSLLISGPDSQLVLLAQVSSADTVVTNADTVVTGSIGNAELDGNDGFFEVNNSISKNSKEKKILANDSEFAKVQHSPSSSALPTTPAVTMPSQQPNPVTESVTDTSSSALPTDTAGTPPPAYKFDGQNKEVLVINKAISTEWTKMPSKIKEALDRVEVVIGGGEKYLFAQLDQEKGLKMFANSQQTKVLILNLKNPAFKELPIE